MFVSMDACFSLVKKGKDSANIPSLHGNRFFLQQDQVDKFVAEYGVKGAKQNDGVSLYSVTSTSMIMCMATHIEYCFKLSMIRIVSLC